MKWRAAVQSRLKQTTFDLLVIGGGATGVGVALDAQSRGLKTALVERGDFASGTSSRSTKLLHGGVRYLEKAIADRNRKQMHLVREALRERAGVIERAPHLAKALPILLPLYHWWEVPYFWTGLKVYDWLSGSQSINPSEFLSAKEVMKRFPDLKQSGLIGGVIYWDGQFDDARLNVELAVQAAEFGAACCNYLEVEALDLQSCQVRDHFTDERFTIHAKRIVNATGPYTDQIRQMVNPRAKPLLRVSQGSHIVVDRPAEIGVLIPKTPDDRVLFLLPWEGKLLIGTTELECAVSEHPRPTEEEIAYLIEQANQYLDLPLVQEEILSAWSGLRPLVQGEAGASASLVRDHLILDEDGLITVTGGKWTTYRQMAEEVVDLIAPGTECKTQSLRLEPPLIREGSPRLHPDYPYTEDNALFAIDQQMACTAEDVVARRLRLQFLDEKAATLVKERVGQLSEHVHKI